MKKISTSIVLSLVFSLLLSTNDVTQEANHWPCFLPGFLDFLYTSQWGSLLRPIITKPWFSILVGNYCDTSLSSLHISSFIKKHSIPIHEAVRSKASDYHSFNDFFTRTLKPEARPIDPSPSSITSPSDGMLFALEDINPETTLLVKNKPFNLAQFLHNAKQAQAFYGGTLIIIYLAPSDYHRFHFPLDCIPSAHMTINGNYESVSPIVYSMGIQPLVENERSIIFLKISGNKSIAFVSVGALCVGRITYTYDPNESYKKGDEVGYFSVGGSTIVLIFEKNLITLDPAILKNQKMDQCTQIKMGQKIGLLKN
jgi:phosphatidylserine decarboxylase